MCGAELNSVTYHRKFDGKLKNIHLNLCKKDTNEDMIEKINDILGLQQIEEFVDHEDEDIGSENESENELAQHARRDSINSFPLVLDSHLQHL